MTLKEITNIIRNKLYSSPDEIESMFQSIKGHLIIPTVTMAADSFIFRASRITDINEVNNIGRLSYKPAHLNTKYGRASIPNKTMFYGISATDYLYAVCSCLGETCPCLREPNPIQEHYMVVISKWVLKRDCLLAAIANIDGLNKSDSFNEFCLDEYLALVSLCSNSQDIIDFWRIMSKEFTKQVATDQEYQISSYFTEMLLSLNKYDGIIYESVQSIDRTLKESLCVGFPPIIADNYLEFECADLWEFDFVDIQTPIVPVKTKQNILSK